MGTGKVSVLEFSLFTDSEKSFISALDEAGIPHSRLQMFSSGPQMNGIIEVVSALSEAMPWNSIAKVIVAWIEARKSRQIMISIDGNKVIHAKGYSAKELEKILPNVSHLIVIETEKNEKT